MDEFIKKHSGYFSKDGTLKNIAPLEVKQQYRHLLLKKRNPKAYKIIKPSDIPFGIDDIIRIECPRHGEFDIIMNNLLRGVFCKKCYSNYSTRCLDQETFLQRSLEVHGPDKYNYNLAEYTHTGTPVKIWCNTCANFFYQKPHYHVSGSNCPSCAGRSYKYLYVLKAIENPSIIKIGITNQPRKRVKSLSRSLGYTWEVLYLFKRSTGSSFKEEQMLHFMFKSFRYCPKSLKGCDGSTELFKIPINHLASIIKHIEVVVKGKYTLEEVL